MNPTGVIIRNACIPCRIRFAQVTTPNTVHIQNSRVRSARSAFMVSSNIRFCSTSHQAFTSTRPLAVLRCSYGYPFLRFAFRWLHLEHVCYHFLERQRDVRNRFLVGCSFLLRLLHYHLSPCVWLAE